MKRVPLWILFPAFFAASQIDESITPVGGWIHLVDPGKKRHKLRIFGPDGQRAPRVLLLQRFVAGKDQDFIAE